MRGLDDFDAAGAFLLVQAVAVTGDDHSSNGRAPMSVKRHGHGGRGLARAEHERWTTIGNRGERLGQADGRLRCGERRGECALEDPARL
jgi:hypothetical protein